MRLRLAVLLATIAAILALLASASASAPGPGTGAIFWAEEIGCGFSISTDGIVFAGFPMDNFEFLGRTSFSDDRFGWVCTGSVTLFRLPIETPLVVTHLTCVVDNAFYPAFAPRPGVLSSSGTAIFYRDGTARLVCPIGAFTPTA